MPEPLDSWATRMMHDSAITPLRIAVAGSSGRMGRMLIEAIAATTDCQLAAAFDHAESSAIGHDAGAPLGFASGVTVTSDLDTGLQNAQCLIDFTRPEGTLSHLDFCLRHHVAMVIGTTGFTGPELQRIQAASEQIPIVMAPNMSIGVNVVLKLLEQAGHALADGYDIEIIEAHHRHKVDAPSGTALKMGEVVAQAAGRNLERDAVWARHGHTGERQAGSIGFSVIRGGDIVGDHTVLFAGAGERIEITHKSSSRATYASGSLRAARFLAGKTSGLYDMQAVLGLTS